MKKLIGIIVVLLFLFTSCVKQGTLTESQATQNKPCVINGDTIDLYAYWPNSLTSIWIAKVRNSNPPVVSLTYQQGKTYESVIIIDHNDWLVKKQRVINGSVISENDSIIVIKKKK